MLNAIWAFMILLAVFYAACTGHMDDVTNAALDSAGEAISLCLTMAGVVALWMGLMEIAEKAGLIRKLTNGISPFLTFLFPRIPKEHPAREYIAANVIANVLGLGWACTPAGLKAMEELAKLEAQRGNPEYLEMREASESGRGRQAKQRSETGRNRRDETQAGGSRRASNEMCVFLILNISSLQLVPVNMIAYRAQYGSTNPTAIIAPAIAATLVSTIVAVVYCKVKDHASRDNYISKGEGASRRPALGRKSAERKRNGGGKAA
ncbi:MAG: nucleoside recognition protein [Roseburia sp.]|nr:nucleoside recognition protein [Roseburia sp.]MCM1098238.1 nucleoside recognition protein [Ruminococcus flavefaciens]